MSRFGSYTIFHQRVTLTTPLLSPDITGRTCVMMPCVGHRSKAQHMGRKLVSAMKDKLGKQLFEVVIQASANGDIVARETVKVCSHLQ